MAAYLVTGGAGFIGSHLVDSLLADGHQVRVLDDLSTGRRANLPPRVELRVADVAAAAAMSAAMAGVAGCFHLAAVASVERSTIAWLATHRANLTGTIAVLDAAAKADGGPVPVVYASSAAVYGDCRDIPLAEMAPTRPLSAYGADKLGCELHARVAARVHRVPSFGTRFFNIYGPRQDPRSPYSGVISIFAERIAAGEPVTLHGDGGQSRDFVYVGDAVRALRLGMDRIAGSNPARAEVANVCTGRATTIAELLALIAGAVGRHPKVLAAASRPGDIRESLGCPGLAEALLGFRAVTPIEAGLRRLVESRLAGAA